MCVFLWLVLTGYVSKKFLFKWMEWIALAIVVALATGSFIAAMHEHHAKNIMLNNNMNRFLIRVVIKRYQSDADTILVWMEHCFISKKYSTTKEFFLQFLYCWYWPWHIDG